MGLFLALFLLSVSIIQPRAAVAQELKLRTVETGYMRLVYYDEQHAYIIPHLTRTFENSLAFHRSMFDYTPSEKITVILRDFNDHGYAGATSLPTNYLIIGIEPYEQVYETSPTNERLNWVMSHELLHVVASDQAASTDRFWRTLFFGKVNPSGEDPISMFYSFLTSPRHYAPRWYHEGLAVFMETWMAGGYGRVLGGYDEMVFRTMVADDAYFYDVVGLESEGSTIDFQIGQNAYLYGTRFVSYLAYHYGPNKVIEWMNRVNGTRRGFAGQFKRIFDASLSTEWGRWIEFEHEWQSASLDSLRQYPVTEFRPLSRRPLGSVSRACYDASRRKLYTAVLYPGEVSHVVEIDVDTWQERKIVEIPTPALYYVASLAYDDSSGTIFYTTDNSQRWRDLWRVDVKTRKKKLLLKDIRTGDLAFNRVDKSLWGIRHHNGLTRVVMMPPPYEDGYEILELPYGRDMFDIDVSPDGRYLTGSYMEISGRQRLIRMKIDDLMMGESLFETLFEFQNYSPANFVHSPDGRYLFGTTYLSGVSNVTRYDFDTGKMEWITNAETGFFRPVPFSPDSLAAFRYTSEGFEPVMLANRTTEDVAAIRFLGQAIVEEHPMVMSWMLGSPLGVSVDSTMLAARDYSGWRNIRLNALYPIVQSYETRVAWGLRLDVGDPMFVHALELSALYTPSPSLPSSERGHAMANYTHWPWTFGGWWNRSNFYDFFGPTKRSRKGYSLDVGYEGILIDDKPVSMDYTVHVAGYGGLDRLPQYQNVRAVFEEYLSGSIGMGYESYRKTIGGVESEKGIGWDVDFMYNYVNPDNATINQDVSGPGITLDQKNYPRLWTTLKLGFLLPLDHSSVWLRPAIGYSYFKSGNRNEPLANYYFGGFGNNWVDNRSVKRYREYYAFPGVDLNAIAGTNFAKLLVEWTLPPKRFRRFGVRSLYCTWMHLSLFTTAIVTNLDDNSLRQSYVDAGGQVDFKIVIFSHMSSTFSLGYAAAIQDGGASSDQFMISLKI